jgi:hypothetical protein
LSACQAETAAIILTNARLCGQSAPASPASTITTYFCLLSSLPMLSKKRRYQRRCQIPQVDITELSGFFTVVKPIYSPYSFRADSDQRLTILINESSSMSLCRT